MNYLQKILKNFDSFQQKHKITAFPVAVIKKYDDDQAGQQAALLTYYGFLAIFPLLLVLTTVVQMVARNNPEVQKDVIDAATSYIPVLGTQLSSNIDGLHQSGLALAIGLLFTFYGARGVAEAFRYGVNHIWGVPRSKQDGFPKSTIKNIVIIIVGGLGFIGAAVCSSVAAHAGNGATFRVLSLFVSVFILFWVFNFLMEICLPRKVPFKAVWVGALATAIGLVAMQVLGTYLLTNHLKNLDALYSYFALALGLLFWLYLQAQIVFYSLEIATVHNKKAWPRSLTDNS